MQPQGEGAVKQPWGDIAVGRGRCAPAPPLYLLAMKTVLIVLLGIAMLGTLGILLAGMVGVVRDGDPRRSNALMRWRVILQGAALVLFVMLMMLSRG